MTLSHLRPAYVLCTLALLCGLAWTEEPAFVPPQVSRCTIRVVTAKALNQFMGKTFFPIDIEPAFVLTVEFVEDCKVLEKKAGDQAHLGFHSVAETFGDPFGEVNGRTYTIDVTKMVINGKVRYNIRKALGAAKEQEPKKNPEPE